MFEESAFHFFSGWIATGFATADSPRPATCHGFIEILRHPPLYKHLGGVLETPGNLGVHLLLFELPDAQDSIADGRDVVSTRTRARLCMRIENGRRIYRISMNVRHRMHSASNSSSCYRILVEYLW